MHDTFLSLLQDRAHWEFELFLMTLFDGLVAGILWPFVRLHWRHHLARDEREGLHISWAKNIGHTTDDGRFIWVNAGPGRWTGIDRTGNWTGLRYSIMGPEKAEKPAKTMDTPMTGMDGRPYRPGQYSDTL